jgi:conjugative transfer region protein TrbK
MRDRPDRVLKLIAFAMGGLVLLMAAIELGKAVREDMGTTVMPSTDNPLRMELARCRDLTPEDLATDTDCQAAWAENRRRFFDAPADAPED